MLCKTWLISLLSQELAQSMWLRDTWNVECCISQLEVETLLTWAEKITCVLMKWHWFSIDTWTASKCNQILCKSNYRCSILMTTLLPVTFISGSCLISLNEPKVCIPQKGKLSIGTLESYILQTTSTSVSLTQYIYISIYLRIQRDCEFQIMS